MAAAVDVVMDGVREYGERMDVALAMEHGRVVIYAKNEGGCNGTVVDLEDLLAWLDAHPNWRDELK